MRTKLRLEHEVEGDQFLFLFVPPVANDSGSAIGTAIDAQFHFTGNPKIDWNVYSGCEFVANDAVDSSLCDEYKTDHGMIADVLASNVILGWVNGKCEIGPRALGNRSILASPFQVSTRVRLNEIKQREQFRPIAPVCLEDDAARYFSCERPSPFMLYTHPVFTDALAAVTHVNGDGTHSNGVLCDKRSFVRVAQGNWTTLADWRGAIEISHFAHDRLRSSAFYGGRVQPTTGMA